MPTPTETADLETDACEMEEAIEPAVGEATTGIVKHSRRRARKSKLYESIRNQMEFYFSDANLSKQRVMKEIVQASEYVLLSLFIEKFNKMSQISKNIDDIRRALKNSEKLDLSPDETGVKRKVPFDESKVKSEQDVENCTIYVENTPATVNHDWLVKIFQEFGRVSYVSIPQFKTTKQPKGFAFVEFEDEESAKRCLEAYGEIGACLPTNMDPSSLQSISSFRGEEGNSSKKGKNERNKRKRTKAEASPEMEGKEEEVVKKKLKPGNTAEETETKNSKAESLNKAVTEKPSDPEELPASESEAMPQGDGLKSKKKKRRKRKCTNIPESEEKLESDLIHLKILPKQNWRQLRNRYLNLQRENFGKLKAQMRNSKNCSQAFHPQQTSSGAYKSACVKVNLSAPAESRQDFLNQITSGVVPPDWSNLLKYVDYPDGGMEAVIRLDGAPRARPGIHAFLSRAKAFFNEANLMSEKETDEYWASSKAKLKEKKKEKVRGKDRLINQATKFASSSHIHFEEAGEEPAADNCE